MDEQGDDVALVEAEERVVASRRVGKDGPHSSFPGHVETGRLGRGPGQTDISETVLVCRRKEMLLYKISVQTYIQRKSYITLK